MAPHLMKRETLNQEVLTEIYLFISAVVFLLIVVALCCSFRCFERRKKKPAKVSYKPQAPAYARWFSRTFGKRQPTDPETGIQLQPIPLQPDASATQTRTSTARTPNDISPAAEPVKPTFNEMFGCGSTLAGLSAV